MSDSLDAMLREYVALRDQAAENPGRGTAEHIAYWNIVKSLKAQDPSAALESRIAYHQKQLDDHVAYERRQAFLDYERRCIELTQRAIECYRACML